MLAFPVLRFPGPGTSPTAMVPVHECPLFSASVKGAGNQLGLIFDTRNKPHRNLKMVQHSINPYGVPNSNSRLKDCTAHLS